MLDSFNERIIFQRFFITYKEKDTYIDRLFGYLLITYTEINTYIDRHLIKNFPNIYYSIVMFIYEYLHLRIYSPNLV